MKKMLLPFVMLVCSLSVFAQYTAGTLTVTFSTKTITSQTYSVYAIYITNSSAALVNTLAYRTTNSNSSASSDLSTWWTLIGKSLTGAKFIGTTDGISGATTSNTWYTAQKVYWGKTTSVATIPDGNYVVNHKDNTRTNNKTSNLEYITKGENNMDKNQSTKDRGYQNVTKDRTFSSKAWDGE